MNGSEVEQIAFIVYIPFPQHQRHEELRFLEDLRFLEEGELAQIPALLLKWRKVAEATLWLQVTVPNSWQRLRVLGLGAAGAVPGVLHPMCS